MKVHVTFEIEPEEVAKILESSSETMAKIQTQVTQELVKQMVNLQVDKLKTMQEQINPLTNPNIPQNWFIGPGILPFKE